MPDTDQLPTVEITVNQGTVLLVAAILRIERDLSQLPLCEAHVAIARARLALIAESELLKGKLQ